MGNKISQFSKAVLRDGVFRIDGNGASVTGAEVAIIAIAEETVLLVLQRA